jgi:flagellar biosynthesis protein FliP
MTADSSWLGQLALILALGIIPFLIISGTSFAKIAIVLSITKNALGAPGIPPASVITALAVVMTIFIMTPVINEIITLLSSITMPEKLNFNEIKIIYDTISDPIIDFLTRNTPGKEIDFFRQLAGQTSADQNSLRILLPAFASAELIEAFLMGVLIYVPFLTVDLIVANTLAAMGLQSMSPLTIAFPLKVLLFLSVDGWHLIVTALMISYGL